MFGVGKNSIFLIFVGAASPVLVETYLYGLFCLSHICFITTSIGTSKSMNNVALFIPPTFVFDMH